MGESVEKRLLVHCNAGGSIGAGHLMRVLAVVEEAVGRGWTARLLGDIQDDLRERLDVWAPGVEVERVPIHAGADALAARVTQWRPAVLHLDTYVLADESVPRGDHLVSNVQDAPFGTRHADLIIDPNLGAEHRIDPALGPDRLLGAPATLIRRQVRSRVEQVRASTGAVARLLVVLGGTDASGLTTAVVRELVSLPGPLRLTVVTPAAQRADLERIAATARHPVTLTGFLEDLPAAVVEHDLVVSAAGTSVWDFAHLGVPAAILAVTENQVSGYRAAIDAGMALGLGEPPHTHLAENIRSLADSLAGPRRLADLARRAQAAIDGLGAWRVVSAWEQLRSSERRRSPGPALEIRPAAIDDAALLLSWRNDPVTRASSRSTEEVGLADHMAWLERVLADPDRRLYVALDHGAPVATVRWDRHDSGAWEASITVAASARGRGTAGAALRAAEAALDTPDPVLLVAAIHEDNLASRSLFTRAGYLPHRPADAAGFAVFAKWRLPSAPLQPTR
jgi:spore coat polysaccharide biosynthesis predicted glycosyltransferase SpsG/RimJ/RimL family protein N-acetyltransferase